MPYVVVRYEERLGDAQVYGIKKAVYGGGSMGAVWFIIYCVYALAFWYGIKLTIDEPDNYSGGEVLIVRNSLSNKLHDKVTFRLCLPN